MESRFAGETVWARHEPTGQQEATAIADDGTYTLELRFTDIAAESPIIIETPAYQVEASLGDLTTGIVTGDSRS